MFSRACVTKEEQGVPLVVDKSDLNCANDRYRCVR